MSYHHHHEHKHHHSTGKNLLFAALLNLVITSVEIVGGILANSIALLSDALHNLSDGIAVFLAYLADKVSKKQATTQHTFGLKRVEILTALINGVVLSAICIYLLFESYKRLLHPSPVNGLLMLAVAFIGLLANFIAMTLLKHDKNHNLNVKAAYLHLLGDTLSSVGVIIGGVLIYFFNILWLDPVITILISIYIFKETYSIIKQSVLILLQVTPPNFNILEVKTKLEAMPEIENIHHVHVWKLNDSQIHFECHIDLKTDLKISETNSLSSQIKTILHNEFKVEHTTIQFEYNCCNNKSIVY
jgi:cobalt-zinc-cadmium efflux system protein